MRIYTALLTGTADPQRGFVWQRDPALVEELAVSVARHGHVLRVLADEHEGDTEIEGSSAAWFTTTRLHDNPYFARWCSYEAELGGDTSYPDSPVWLVDGTDVVMLHEPTVEPGVLYVGSETNPVGIDWLYRLHPSVQRWIEKDPNRPMMNAGIVGGMASVVLPFVADLANAANDTDTTDMGVFNRVAYSDKWVHRIRTGLPVHTIYKAFEHDHPTAWWRHK